MFKKVIVLEVFTDSLFYSDENIQDLMKYYGVKNSYYLNRSIPPNTIIGIDADKNNGRNIKLYFPFFSHIQRPIKVGEWAWTLDDNEQNYSYWLSRVVTPSNAEDSNYTHNDKQFLGSDDLNHLLNGDRFYSIDPDNKYEAKKFNYDKSLNLNLYENKEYENLIQNSISENFVQKEPIPKVIARPGEHLIEGSNNSYILLGTDRTINKINASIKDSKELKIFQNKTKIGQSLKLRSLTDGTEFDVNSKEFLVFEKSNEKNIGCIDIVAGKVQKKYFEIIDVKSEDTIKTLWSERDKNLNKSISNKIDYFKNVDEPNFSDDKSRIFISERTNLSNNFKLNWKNDNDLNGIFAAVSIKSDNVLNIGRKKVGLIFQENENSSKENCSYVFLGKDIEIKSSKEANISMTNENVSINLKGNKISIGNNNDELIKNLYSLIKVLIDNASSTTLSSIGPTSLNPNILSELQKIILSLKRIGNV